MAKMTPYLKKHVANSLAPLQEELSRSQQRVKGLEEGIDKLFEAIDQPSSSLQLRVKLQRRPAGNLEPAPDRSIRPFSLHHHTTTTTTEPSLRASHRHLLALHENLRTIVTDLSLNHNHLSRRVEQGDAHNSMVCINDRLRLEEQLSIMSNALFSTRAQVQWLLNRERTLGAAIDQQQQQQQAAMRGRALAATVVGQAQTAEPGAGANGSGNGNGNEYPAGTGPGIAGPQLRPARRTSGGGSQERVKL
ncbi:hypothetical protein EPUS_07971 [Endocarpon pusillum Z07020]|uniref:Uncharacterized protein n=1 Tax=Endocarpon pusillum (strain Z07020 / HMAS-L-300199) TaxID=1263415 RepID=U1HJX7_ENDPU|nr:uncharacterized protein EPUS_07971 [Endocarpon pusillum Z07020]ERF70550.1 hypothetical protein EPUS_07971 [Endocarpon pusillum Z07020]